MSLVVHGQTPHEEGEGQPSTDQLASTLERVHDELRGARLMARQIELADALADHVVDALREALLVRVLRLRQFYYGTAGAPGEIVAADFFAGSTRWKDERPAPPAHLMGWLDDLTPHVQGRVYVVEASTEVPRTAWPLSAAVGSLLSIHKRFCEMIVQQHGTSGGEGPWPGFPDLDILFDSRESILSDAFPGPH